MIKLVSPSGTSYEVHETLLGGTDTFNLYECQPPDRTNAILKIAKTIAENGLLDREAYILQLLRDGAKSLEEEYAVATGGTNPPLNNHFFFPNLIETFTVSDQENRRVLLLQFPDISKKLSDLVPLSYITKDRLRVDPRTSAWILGKLLKLLVFTQQLGIAVGTISADNILINKKEHLVCLFDWSDASTQDTETPPEVTSKEISCITKEVLNILGVLPDGSLPSDDQLIDKRYEDYLKRLSSGTEHDPDTAHQQFYELIRSLWPREYHPFTTKIL